MAKRKDKSPAVTEGADTPKLTQAGEKLVAESAASVVEAVKDEFMSTPCAALSNSASEEVAAPAPQAPVVQNVVGASIDIDAVIAKHLAASAPETSGSSKVPVSRSSVIRPVKLVHVIASEMYQQNPEMKRKDVIAACEAAGIATHTARTQYQIWAQAMRNDSAPKPAAPMVVPGKDPSAKRR